MNAKSIIASPARKLKPAMGAQKMLRAVEVSKQARIFD
jgi:hypothetical protein